MFRFPLTLPSLLGSPVGYLEEGERGSAAKETEERKQSARMGKRQRKENK